MNQLNFFNQQSSIANHQSKGAQLRDRGMKRAAQHAEDVSNGWSQKALDFLYLYARNHHRFSGEMVRMEARGTIEEPPSLRAWDIARFITEKYA